MDSLWMLYWITRLDAIIATLGVFQFFLLIASVVSCVIAGSIMLAGNGKEKFEPKWMKSFAIMCIVFLSFVSVLKALVPTKQDAMFIAAGWAVTELVQSESAKRIASKSVGVVESWLDKQQKELKKEGK